MRAIQPPSSLLLVRVLGRALGCAWALLLASPAWPQSACGSETLARTLEARAPGVAGPRLRTPAGPPIVGRAFSLRVDAGPPGAPGVLVVGLSELSFFVPKYAATLFPGPPSLAVQAFTLDGHGVSPALQAMTGLDPSLCGLAAFAQAGLLDPSAMGGVALTNGLRLRIGVVTSPPAPGLAVELPAPPRTMSSGDMDGDGILDLVVADDLEGELGVALGQGDGSFVLVESEPFGQETCYTSELSDLDLDGDLDVVVMTRFSLYEGRFYVFLGNGDGTVAAPVRHSASSELRDLVVADFDGDGAPDLAVTHRFPDLISIYEGLGDGSFQGPTSFSSGADPEDVVSADFDGDGDADLAVETFRSVSIHLGNGDGSFAAPIGYPQGLIWGLAPGDLDGDSILDLAVVTGAPPTFQLMTLIGLGDGTFTPGPELILPGAKKFVGGPRLRDLDGDGILDAAFSGGAGHGMNVALGQGDGSFAAPTAYPTINGKQLVEDFDGDGLFDLVIGHTGAPFAAFYRGQPGASFPKITRIDDQTLTPDIASADFDGDGAPDLAIPNRDSQLVTIQLGDGAGGFTQVGQHVAGDSIQAIRAADLDGDGDQDLALPNAVGVAILLGDGAGGFAHQTSYPIAGQMVSVDLGDLDEDGRVDLVIARASGDLAFLEGTGGGSFAPARFIATLGNARSVRVLDLDSDGALDLVVANGFLGDVVVHYGFGNGTFTDPISYPAGPQANSLDAGDLDGDGILDLAVTLSSADQVAVLLGLGGRGFAAPASFAGGDRPESLRLADLDEDDHLDLVTINVRPASAFAGGGTVAVHIGHGDGTFEPLQRFAVQDRAISLEVSDFDLDGVLDIAVVEFDSVPAQVLVLLNPIGG